MDIVLISQNPLTLTFQFQQKRKTEQNGLSYSISISLNKFTIKAKQFSTVLPLPSVSLIFAFILSKQQLPFLINYHMQI